ncbi:MAG: 2-oxoacid:acceptor oxidoreductase family protein [Thermodesulfobacteriota bacterium]
MTQLDLTIAGLGGQGSILAGVILGSAAVTYDGKFAVQTQAYSSELRGGFAATWVIISDKPIVFPRVTRPDILVAQAQDSISRFAATLKPEGSLIIDADMVHRIPQDVRSIYEVHATTAAHQRLKAPLTANMIMLGALCRVTGIVSREALEKAISAASPQGKDRLNLEAFDFGFEAIATSR